EIWWDVTTREFKNDTGDVNDYLQVAISGCAIDFNLWSSAHSSTFGPDFVFLGAAATPLSSVAGFSDTYPGVNDPYQSQAGQDPKKDPNTTVFTPKNLPGESYNLNGLIQSGDSYACDPNYGSRYAGAFAYEGDGIEFSTNCQLPLDEPPTLLFPSDTVAVYCGGDSVCLDLFGSDPNSGDTLTLTLLAGPVTFTPVTGVDTIATTVCFRPDTGGVYRFIWQLADQTGLAITDTVDLTINGAPLINDQYFSFLRCIPGQQRDLQVQAYDSEGDPISWALVSGVGSIDQTGLLTYVPDTAGIYHFVVGVSDSCGTASANVYDTVTFNGAPYLTTNDTTLFVCDTAEICLTIAGTDPEGGPITIDQVDGPGTFTMLTDSSGQTCFVPADVDSATYMFVYCLGDDCPPGGGGPNKYVPICYRDTVFVTVLRNKPPQIVCPPAQEFFTCDSGTFCFDVDGNDPEFGPLTFNVLSGNAVIDGKTVCVVGTTSDSFDVAIEVVDSCGAADTCVVPVTIHGNRPPVVVTAADFSVALCAPEAICLKATADDPDFDIASVVTNYGSYDATTDRVCFDADTAGVYEIIVTATDSCGAAASDTTLVTVDLNSPPVVVLGADVDAGCVTGDVCVPAGVTDDNLKVISPNLGTYDSTAGTVCFVPDTAGTYTVVLQATDDCGETAADTALVTVHPSHPPVVTDFNDTTVYICAPQYICLTPQIHDADGDIVSVTVSGGSYKDSTICFVPYTQGTYDLIVTVTDSCGNTTVDTATVTVDTDQDVMLSGPPDTSIFLCEPDTLCFPISGIPANAQVSLTGTGVWWDDATQSVCFYSTCCLENKITVTATTPCGSYDYTFNVSVQTNSAPLVILPPDTSLALCGPEQICL
ncbi:MAG: hypothetical protein D6800_04405, partial [Candidatus Zixiibacteriota bacterium]